VITRQVLLVVRLEYARIEFLCDLTYYAVYAIIINHLISVRGTKTAAAAAAAATAAATAAAARATTRQTWIYTSLLEIVL
jgi:hypothetical protein